LVSARILNHFVTDYPGDAGFVHMAGS
jgi:hypothetical protein